MNFNFNPTLKGHLVSLHPIKENDFEELFLAASDPLIWEQHPYKDRYTREGFKKFFQSAVESPGAFMVRDLKNNKTIGSTRYYEYNPKENSVAIGYTFLQRVYWGGKYNKDMKKLLFDHAFQYVDRVILHVDERNTRSQKATERIGAKLFKKEPRTDIPGYRLVYEIQKKDW